MQGRSRDYVSPQQSNAMTPQKDDCSRYCMEHVCDETGRMTGYSITDSGSSKLQHLRPSKVVEATPCNDLLISMLATDRLCALTRRTGSLLYAYEQRCQLCGERASNCTCFALQSAVPITPGAAREQCMLHTHKHLCSPFGRCSVPVPAKCAMAQLRRSSCAHSNTQTLGSALVTTLTTVSSKDSLAMHFAREQMQSRAGRTGNTIMHDIKCSCVPATSNSMVQMMVDGDVSYTSRMHV